MAHSIHETIARIMFAALCRGLGPRDMAAIHNAGRWGAGAALRDAIEESGWRLVPAEPTSGMLHAALDVLPSDIEKEGRYTAVYRAMIEKAEEERK